jgi:hypothetical protein
MRGMSFVRPMPDAGVEALKRWRLALVAAASCSQSEVSRVAAPPSRLRGRWHPPQETDAAAFIAGCSTSSLEAHVAAGSFLWVYFCSLHLLRPQLQLNRPRGLRVLDSSEHNGHTPTDASTGCTQVSAITQTRLSIHRLDIECRKRLLRCASHASRVQQDRNRDLSLERAA